MRSAEQSGTGAKRFVAANDSEFSGFAVTSGTVFGRLLDALPPLTLAVGATAFAAAAREGCKVFLAPHLPASA